MYPLYPTVRITMNGRTVTIYYLLWSGHPLLPILYLFFVRFLRYVLSFCASDKRKISLWMEWRLLEQEIVSTYPKNENLLAVSHETSTEKNMSYSREEEEEALRGNAFCYGCTSLHKERNPQHVKPRKRHGKTRNCPWNCLFFLSIDFEVSSGFRQTRNRNSVLLANNSRGRCLKTWTGRKTKEWLDGIQTVITGDPGEKCIFVLSVRNV